MRRPVQHKACCYPRDLDRWYGSREGILAAQIEAEWIRQSLPPVRRRIVHYGPSCQLRPAYRGMEPNLIYLRDENEPGMERHTGSQVLVNHDRWPLRDECCHAVVVSHMQEVMPDLEDMFSQWSRVLVPEGRLIVLTCNAWSLWGFHRLAKKRQWYWWQQCHSRRRWRTLGRSHGMDLVQAHYGCFWPLSSSKNTDSPLGKSLKVEPLLETMMKVACPGAAALICYVFKKSEAAWLPPDWKRWAPVMGSASMST